jgi:hypothetical protein
LAPRNVDKDHLGVKKDNKVPLLYHIERWLAARGLKKFDFLTLTFWGCDELLGHKF